ncbi:radical SAM protein [Geoglobus acetivorans]|nr:radical SAM protein [Geoglobus acetivorans]
MIEFPPYRPPSEARSTLIRVTRGCPWNRCAFCGMYKTEKFSIRDTGEIKKDISVASEFSKSRTVFFGDSDNLVHPDLIEITKFAVEKLNPERITSYARLKTASSMSLKGLKEIRESGLTRLHFGLESGDDETLEMIKKGISSKEAIEGGKKAKKAGFEVSLYILSGITEKWEQHALNSAKAISKIEPDFVRLRSITVIPNTILWNRMKKGIYKPLDPVLRLKEVKLLVENVECETMLFSDHVSNYLWSENGPPFYTGVSGRLPEDRERILEVLERAIKTAEALKNSGKLVDSNMLASAGKIVL